MTDAKPSLKAKALHEFRRFATMFAYLWVMFFLLQLHQYVILAQRHIPFEQYGVGLINALVLAKVMLVADDLRLGEWRGRQRRPLIYPVLLRSILFAIVFIVFDIFEKMVIGVLHGKSVADSIETFGGGGVLGAVLVAIIVAIALIPFFGFVELISWEFPRLCRGGSSSLTFPTAAAERGGILLERKNETRGSCPRLSVGTGKRELCFTGPQHVRDCFEARLSD